MRYHLNLLPENEFQIFFDLRLNVHNIDFQIDCLLLSPFLSIIIESKNIAGTLIFDSRSEQCIRIYNGKEEGFSNPILQATRHQLLFQKWLKQYKFPPLPIENFVSIAFPSTIIKSANDDYSIYEKVLQAEGAIHKVDKIKQKYKKERLKTNQLNALCEMLLNKHTPLNMRILEKYEINDRDLVKGVICPTCPLTIMIRKFGTWFCPRCQTHSKTTHVHSLVDYFLLFGPSITKRQFSEFTLISNPKTAAYLLSTSTLPNTYQGNKISYYPPSTDWYYEDPRIKKLI